MAKKAEPPPHLFKSLLVTVEVLTSKQLHLRLQMGHVTAKSSGLSRIFPGMPCGTLASGVGTEVTDWVCFPS